MALAPDQSLEDRKKIWEWLRDRGDGAALSAASYAVPVALGLIMMIGAVGNGAVLYVVCRYRRMKNVPSAFLVNIAIANLLSLFAASPFVMAYYVAGDWQLGVVTCKLAEAVQTFSMALCSFHVVALSAERYAAFAAPPRRRAYARRRACFGIGVIWILAAVVATPDAVSSNVQVRGDGARSCAPFTDAWGHQYPKIHTIVSACVLIGLPLLLVVIFYTSLGCVVCGKKRREKRIRKRGSYQITGQTPKPIAHASDGSLRIASSTRLANGVPAENGAYGNRTAGPEASLRPWGDAGGGAGGARKSGIYVLNGDFDAPRQASGSTPRREIYGGGSPKKDRRSRDRSRSNELRDESRRKEKKLGARRPSRDSEPWQRDGATGGNRRVTKRVTMAKVTLLLSLQLAILWGPKFAYRAWVYFADPTHGGGADDVAWSYVKLAGLGGTFANAALAPFIVIGCNKNFGRYLRKYLCCCFGCAACCCIDDERDEASGNSSSSAAECAPCCARGGSEADMDADEKDAVADSSCEYRTPPPLPAAAILAGYRGNAYYDPYTGQRLFLGGRCVGDYGVALNGPACSSGGGLYSAGMLTDMAHLRRPAGDPRCADPAPPQPGCGSNPFHNDYNAREQPVYGDGVGRRSHSAANQCDAVGTGRLLTGGSGRDYFAIPRASFPTLPPPPDEDPAEIAAEAAPAAGNEGYAATRGESAAPGVYI